LNSLTQKGVRGDDKGFLFAGPKGEGQPKNKNTRNDPTGWVKKIEDNQKQKPG